MVTRDGRADIDEQGLGPSQFQLPLPPQLHPQCSITSLSDREKPGSSAWGLARLARPSYRLSCFSSRRFSLCALFLEHRAFSFQLATRPPILSSARNSRVAVPFPAFVSPVRQCPDPDRSPAGCDANSRIRLSPLFPPSHLNLLELHPAYYSSTSHPISHAIRSLPPSVTTIFWPLPRLHLLPPSYDSLRIG